MNPRMPLYAKTQEVSNDAVVVWDGPDGGAYISAIVTDGPAGTEGREVRVLLTERSLSILSRRAQVAALNIQRKNVKR